MTSQESHVVKVRRQRLKRWIDIHYEGLQASFVAATGINQGELSGLLKRKSFGEKRALSLEIRAGMPIGYLSGLDKAEQNSNNGIEGNSPKKVPDIGYICVKQLDAGAAMGTGYINDDFPELVKSVNFSTKYIRSLIGFLPHPDKLKLVTGVGDSMSPKIKPGENVLVYTGCNEYVGDGLYLINCGFGHQIKALQARSDGIYITSMDNTLYPPVPVDENTVVGGRVYLIQHFERVA